MNRYRETLIDETRQIIATSTPWEKVTEGLAIMDLARVGPIDMSKWSDADHMAARLWAREGVEQPQIITDYLEKFPCNRPTGVVTPYSRLEKESVVVWYEGPPGTEIYVTLTKDDARAHAEAILRLLEGK